MDIRLHRDCVAQGLTDHGDIWTTVVFYRRCQQQLLTVSLDHMPGARSCVSECYESTPVSYRPSKVNALLLLLKSTVQNVGERESGRARDDIKLVRPRPGHNKLALYTQRKMSAGSKVWLIFNYGSNSTRQLRARVKNPSLQTQPAYVDGYVRVFCFRSKDWGGGGVASLAPADGRVYGSVASLSDVEKKRLDKYESVYRLVEMRGVVGSTETPMHAYIEGRDATRSGGAFTGSMEAAPSEQYLCAVHVMLREHYNMRQEVISVRSCRPDGTVETLPNLEWRHPSVQHLGLEALCVEINSHKNEAPWEMPSTIAEFVRKLNQVGITTPSQLQACLHINRVLPNGQRFGSDTLAAIRKTFEEG